MNGRPRNDGLAGSMMTITAAGLLSALIDGTLGWEQLLQEILRQLIP
ncbi:MAG: hypothetical protein KF804_06370 [Burkholderiales bacterium]|nr:hypothetical protein [Burkholderiales bacterium]